MNRERLDGDDAIQLLLRQHLSVVAIDARCTMARRHLPPQLLTQNGKGGHLAVGKSDVVSEMGALPHAAAADKTQTNFRHRFPSVLRIAERAILPRSVSRCSLNWSSTPYTVER